MANNQMQAFAAKQAFKRGFNGGKIKVNNERLKFFHAQGLRLGQMKAMQAAGVGKSFQVAEGYWAQHESANGRGVELLDDADLEEIGAIMDDSEFDEADLDDADADDDSYDEADDDEADADEAGDDDEQA
jgi:hypothetical protein